jgi:hypothetical protein
MGVWVGFGKESLCLEATLVNAVCLQAVVHGSAEAMHAQDDELHARYIPEQRRNRSPLTGCKEPYCSAMVVNT